MSKLLDVDIRLVMRLALPSSIATDEACELAETEALRRARALRGTVAATLIEHAREVTRGDLATNGTDGMGLPATRTDRGSAT